MKSIIQALTEVTTADWKQEHDKMYKDNYWYKAWYDLIGDSTKLTNKLEDVARIIGIYLEDYMPLPDGCDKDEWSGYVLVTEDTIKRLLKEGKEAETLIKSLKKQS